MKPLNTGAVALVVIGVVLFVHAVSAQDSDLAASRVLFRFGDKVHGSPHESVGSLNA
jgi:hypothetical protein